jgi:hypothetical protein
MPDGLILRIRTEALLASLEKIKKILESAPDRKADLATLDRRLQNVTERLRTAYEAVAKVQVALQFKDSSQETADSAGSIQADLKRILEEVRSGQNDIAMMRQKCFHIQGTEFGTAVEESLKARTDAPLNALTDLQARLNDAATTLDQEWPRFLRRARCVSENIFAEYIEFLGGLALRDAGFDMQISQLAEEVVRTYSVGRNVGMLAIPARQQAMAMTLARIIRVTFPDWTIWSLPSTAYEFWRVVAQKDLTTALRIALRKLTNKNDTVEPRFAECLGDAFATYTLGPAYAFFCICLQLDPTAAYSGSRVVPGGKETEWDCGEDIDKPDGQTGAAAASGGTAPPAYPGDSVRVRAILHMLELMDSKGPDLDPAYKAVRDTLFDAWTTAVEQSSAKPSPNELAAYQADAGRVSLLVEALWNTPDIKTSASFTIQVWNEVQTWVEPLLNGTPEEIQKPAGAELRHVLNAVWLARVDPRWKPERAAAANALADRIRAGGKN